MFLQLELNLHALLTYTDKCDMIITPFMPDSVLQTSYGFKRKFFEQSQYHYLVLQHLVKAALS
jgi:hypothetical protein